ncbi:MAG: tetratricopeptide repeat protein [Tepidisphaeraceae bacterium]|jgi:predicted O-linked N-acetylglucosamine transferase (SPINDLY family)
MSSATETLAAAAEHHKAARYSQAEALYRQVLASEPQNAEALHMLGTLLAAQRHYAQALDMIRAAIAIDPTRADYYCHLGVVLAALGQQEQAMAAYERSLALRPEVAEAWFNLGCAAKVRGDLNQAIRAFNQAISLRPDYAEAHSNLADALCAQGHWSSALGAARAALKLRPDYPEALFNLANSLQNCGDCAGAIVAYLKALALRPAYPEALSNLAHSLWKIGQVEAAAAACRQALTLQPNFAEAYGNLGNALLSAGRQDEAIAALRPASVLPMYHSNLLLAMQSLPSADPAAVFAEHLAWSQRHAGPLAAQIQPHANNPDPDRRLRIGYVSPDFRSHSVAAFFEPLLGEHDDRQVEAWCYSDTAQADQVTARLKQQADHWRDIVGWTDERVAEQIRHDAIDILVDLAGHTAGNRLLLFARKPAPVQVTYLGYPATTGLRTMDYRLTDAVADPPGAGEPFYTELLVRLPRTFLCFHAPPDAPEVGPLPAKSAGHLTFGSFNNLTKMLDSTLQCWAEILRRVPQSRLVLKCPALLEAVTAARLRQRFAALGIEPARLDLRGLTPSKRQHLLAYHKIDVALDSFPYNGTTTTCEALWMGLPVVTHSGATHAGRVGASLLSTLGLNDLIAQSPQQYVQIAERLAGDWDALAALRAGLRDRMRQSPLMDAAPFAREVEAAYRQMWRRWCHSKS